MVICDNAAAGSAPACYYLPAARVPKRGRVANLTVFEFAACEIGMRCATATGFHAYDCRVVVRST